MSGFEIAMLVCFGAAWPVSIYKSWKTRQVAGKSLPFLFIILVGYAAGILHKIFFHFDPVIYLYALNALMVGIDIGLYLRNRVVHVRQSLLAADHKGVRSADHKGVSSADPKGIRSTGPGEICSVEPRDSVDTGGGLK